MRLPNGYGGIVKLSGKRRKPYAARITIGVKEQDGKFIQQYKYIGYFAKRTEAMQFLADYNKGIVLTDNQQSVSDMPTFADVFNRWWEEQGKIKPRSASQANNYTMAFRHMSALHDRRFATIRGGDLQEMILQYSNKSRSTVGFILVVLHGMYKYAMRYDIVDKDYSRGLEAPYSKDKSIDHKPFTDDEIAVLWAHSGTKDCDIALILIYTGMRCSELLGLKTENINLAERYMVAGIKTEAGKNRIIPIADKIFPLIEKRYRLDSEYFFATPRGGKYDFNRFNMQNWKELMKTVGLNHYTHDCRHTFATLSERAGINDYHRKLIMGHAIKDLTNGTYTHVSPKELLADVNRL